MAIKKTQLFKGFVTKNKRVSESQVFDIELVKRDLLYEFHTIKGERVMFPEFGSIIWDLLFEPFTDGIKEEMLDDAISIINRDTRTEIQTIDVNEFNQGQGIRIEGKLLFKPFDVIDTFVADFFRDL